MYTKLCTKLWVALDSLKRDVRGVSAIEYAVLIALVIGAVVAGLSALDIGGIFDNAKGVIDKAVTDTTAPTT